MLFHPPRWEKMKIRLDVLHILVFDIGILCNKFGKIVNSQRIKILRRLDLCGQKKRVGVAGASRMRQLLQFDLLDADEFVHDGENCKARRIVNLQLGSDVATVGGNGVHRKVQTVGYLLAGHSLSNAANNLFFPL